MARHCPSAAIVATITPRPYAQCATRPWGYHFHHGECQSCKLGGEAAYAAIQVAATFIWFPIVRFLVNEFESLEITYNFVGLLGVVSTFGVPYSKPTDSLMRSLNFVNFDMSVFGLQCTGLDYQGAWLVQLLLPLFYPLVCLIHLTFSYLLAMAVRQPVIAQRVLRSGWRPRRDWRFSSLSDAYFPGALFYMNMYSAGTRTTAVGFTPIEYLDRRLDQVLSHVCEQEL